MTGVNRIVLGLVGLCLIAAGVLGVATTRDWVGDATIDDALQFRAAWERWRDIDWTDGALWLLLAGALVIALILVVALFLELRFRAPAGHGRALVEATPRGATTVRIGALRQALQRDIESIAGIDRARLRELEIGERPECRMELRVTPSTSAPAVGLAACERMASALARTVDRPTAAVTAVVEARPAATRRNDDGRAA